MDVEEYKPAWETQKRIIKELGDTILGLEAELVQKESYIEWLEWQLGSISKS